MSYNNNTAWFTAELRQLGQPKEQAFRGGTKAWMKSEKTGLARQRETLNKCEKLQHKLSASDSGQISNSSVCIEIIFNRERARR